MKIITLSIVGVAGLAITAPASAACLEKTPEGVAKLIAVATESDKQLFIERGFREVSCPANIAPTGASVAATCQKLNAYSPEAKTFFQQTYGVTTSEFCAAAQAYVASI